MLVGTVQMAASCNAPVTAQEPNTVATGTDMFVRLVSLADCYSPAGLQQDCNQAHDVRPGQNGMQ
jgi:hypothetical protein